LQFTQKRVIHQKKKKYHKEQERYRGEKVKGSGLVGETLKKGKSAELVSGENFEKKLIREKKTGKGGKFTS